MTVRPLRDRILVKRVEEQEQRIYRVPGDSAAGTGGAISPFSPLSSTTWTELGPSPIPNGQTGPSVAVSGRVAAIAVHPSNPNLIYVGAAQGGVFRSSDGGATWTPIMDSALSLAVGATQGGRTRARSRRGLPSA